MTLTVIILTKDEERHIARAIDSVRSISTRVLVIDSGSLDRTCEIAQDLGAEVLENPWINHAAQMNWAIDQLPKDAEWVLRLDADEIITPALAQEILERLPSFGPNIQGVYVSRRMYFMAKPIRWGGVFPIKVLRLFRSSAGRCENRWMDEHILVSGQTAEFSGEIIDDNQNSLTWWTDKHNAYASREVVDLLNLEFAFAPHDTIADIANRNQASIKRWIKEKIYARLPAGYRALAYFLYRYILHLGFLDGKEGTAFHLLQSLWYRYLVDIKLHEVKTHMRTKNVDAVTAIKVILGIDVDKWR